MFRANLFFKAYPLYIYPRRKQRRIPILIGLFAFACTVCGLFAAIVIGQPDQLLAALNLAKATAPTETAQASSKSRLK